MKIEQSNHMHESQNCNKKKNLPTNKSPGSNGFTVEFYKKFRDEITSVLIKLLQKITEEGKLPNSF